MKENMKKKQSEQDKQKVTGQLDKLKEQQKQLEETGEMGKMDD
jgi:hypothetical protein